MADPMPGTAQKTAGATHIHIEDKKTGFNWLAWLLLALGILALIFALFRWNTTQVAAAPAAAAGATIAATTGASVGQLAPYLDGREATPRTFTFDNLHFDTAASAIQPDDRATVDQVGALLVRYPTTRVRIVGYADARGSSAANLKLGHDRADAVKAALVARNVAANRVETGSGGDADPIQTNATIAGEAENRRTELVVVSR